MAAKFVVVLAAFVACAHSSAVPVARVDADYTNFAYDVADPNTGDYKSQVETRVGGNVAGQYSLLDADGTRRTVNYAADDINGFNAVVRKDPAVVAAPVLAAAPAVVEARVAPAIAAAPAVVAARTLAAPAVVAARTLAAPAYAAPSVYAAAAPGVLAARSYAAPSVIAAAAPGVLAARSYAAPSLIAAGAPGVLAARSYAAPSLIAPSVYSSPLAYAARAAPLGLW